MKDLVLVILCAVDEISENSFVAHDNENINIIWLFWRNIPSYLTLSSYELGYVTHHVHCITKITLC